MDDRQLHDALGSMGKACFVNNFEYFADEGFSREELIELLSKEEPLSTWPSRISNARRIIRAGKARDALMICSGAGVPKPVRDRARRLHDLYGRG